jgi:hypothetical protein
MERRDVQERLNRALAQLVAEDRYLLEKDLSERCIAARLALHLQPEFPRPQGGCRVQPPR